jgi:hypothetical protein
MNAGFLLTKLSLIFLLISFTLFPLVSLLNAEGNDQASALSSWRRTKETFDMFIRMPSSITAREFCDSIPAKREVALDREGVLDYIFGTGRESIITIEMLQGNVYAARAAIKILKFVKDEWEQIVGYSLGTLIRVNPAAYLKACYAEREDPYIKKYGFPVDYIPPHQEEERKVFLRAGNEDGGPAFG